MTFYKRFYLHNSVMDYHPKDIMYDILNLQFLLTDVTCSMIFSNRICLLSILNSES